LFGPESQGEWLHICVACGKCTCASGKSGGRHGQQIFGQFAGPGVSITWITMCPAAP